MKKFLFFLLACLAANTASAGNLLNEGFEYGNHDGASPVGWICNDTAWRCGYLENDHNRIPHNGNWYAYSGNDDAWMFMPLYLIPTLHYRFTCWAIADEGCQLEFWAGSAPQADNMHTLLFRATVEGNDYEMFSSYLETVPSNCEYIAVHATGLRGNYLTIDDIEVDQVEQYTFDAEPISGDTAMYPGSQAVFHFLIHNTGYDPVDVTVHPSNEFFTNFSFYSEGVSTTTFPTQPDEVVKVTVYATLRPEVEPGTVAWLDINMTIPCNCNTALVTFWVTPLDITLTEENNALSISVYPNPATDYVTVEGEDIQQITVYDWAGRMVKCIPVENKLARISLEGLKSGGYLILAKGKEGLARRTFIKR